RTRPTSHCTARSSPRRMSQPSTTTTSSTTRRPRQRAAAGSPAADTSSASRPAPASGALAQARVAPSDAPPAVCATPTTRRGRLARRPADACFRQGQAEVCRPEADTTTTRPERVRTDHGVRGQQEDGVARFPSSEVLIGRDTPWTSVPARATHTCSTFERSLDSRRASAGRSDRRIRADLGHQPGGEIAGALVAHKPATGRREEAHTNMWSLREARDVGGSSHRTAQYASLGHSLGQTAEAASGPQISAEAASALREDAETRARAQLPDGALKRRRVRRSPLDRDLPHSVEDAVQPL